MLPFVTAKGNVNRNILLCFMQETYFVSSVCRRDEVNFPLHSPPSTTKILMILTEFSLNSEKLTTCMK